MNEWPIQRTWRVISPDSHSRTLTTDDLVEEPVCCLLGAAGMGKTFEMGRINKLEQAKDRVVHSARLAALATSPDTLEAKLKELSGDIDASVVIHLDAVDEATIAVGATGRILARWIRDELSVTRPRLRISCRSAVWPDSIKQALNDAYPDGRVTVVSLLPINQNAVRRIAVGEGLNADLFLGGIRRANAEFLAGQPLTLRMLLDLFRSQEGIPSGRSRLFEEAIPHLARERAERREEGTAGSVNLSRLIDVAERLACFVVLSGIETIDLGDGPYTASLGVRDLEQLSSPNAPLDDHLLRAVGRSGLCEGDGSRTFRFVHRQIAEYLAGRRIGGLPFHQSRTLLASGQGWRSGVAEPLLETAAFAACKSPEIAQWIAEHDPEIVGLSDVADDVLRRRATLRLLERFRAHELTDAQLVWEKLSTAGLKYLGIENDLRPVLKERADLCEDVLSFAIDVIDKCEITSLYDDLADLVLDPSAPLDAREAAGYVLQRNGARTVRARLKALVAGSQEDEQMELKGIALQCCWPDSLSSEELISVLTPRRDRGFHGAYFEFLMRLEGEGFDASDCRAAGLKWAESVLKPDRTTDAMDAIVKRIARGALTEIRDPRIGSALAELILEAERIDSDSPLVLLR